MRTAVIGVLVALCLNPVGSAAAAPTAPPPPDPPLTAEATDPPAAPPSNPGADTDGDGVPDDDETSGSRNPWPGGLIGSSAGGDPTDPRQADTDGDGLDDGTEIGTDEQRAGTGTDPNAADTDGDGVRDGREVRLGTDPRQTDSDGDGLRDGAETTTDPTVADSDDDGIADAADQATTAADSTFHFVDVPVRSYYFAPAYWAAEAGISGRSPRFHPLLAEPRSRVALVLRRYGAHLGRSTPTAPVAFRDVARLGRSARAAIGWSASTGILPGLTATRFGPDRTITRAALARSLYRMASWSGHQPAPAPGTSPYTDLGGLPAATRGAIGWLHQNGILQATGFFTSTTRFRPGQELNRAQLITLLYRLDEVIGTDRPAEDTDGDGVTNLDEQQGIHNPYPPTSNGGDVDPISPSGQCLAPGAPFVAGDLPPDPSGPRVPTDPMDPDSDDDGISDGVEMLELRTDPNDADTDDDCLADGVERTGWEIVVDEQGYGTDPWAPELRRYQVVSDPLVNDSDEDGLPDHEERMLRTDAQEVDTDTDGLDDFEEWNRWFTSPASVDSDGDARGATRDVAPTASLFDGVELRDVGTSPTVADTDGDGADDAAELDSPVRDPLLAELPQFEMELAGGTSIRLVKERSSEQGGAISVGLTDSVSQGTSTERSSSVTQAETNSIAVQAGFEYGVEAGGDAAIPKVSKKLSFSIGYSHEWGTERTRSFSTSETVEIARERARTEEESWTSSEAAVRGVISQGMRFRNTGRFTYQLSNVAYSLYLRDLETGAYQVVGTMTVPLGDITLAPGARTQPVQVVADDVDVDLVEEFLESPSAMRFSTANIEFLDSEGRNFEFLQEQTFGQTAQLVLDFGARAPGDPARVEDHNVSTNVYRDVVGGAANGLRLFPGTPLGSNADGPAYQQGLMDQIGYPRCPTSVPAAGCYTTGTDGALTSVDGYANVAQADSGPDQCAARWELQVTTDRQVEQAQTQSIEDVVVRAGDRIRLVRQTDCDGDRLVDSLESSVNASSASADTDGDGLDDLAEARGWIVGTPDPDAAGAPCAADPSPPSQPSGGDRLWLYDSDTCPWVAPNPQLPDSDGDGVGDRQERDGAGRSYAGSPIDLRANPLDRDSDGDLQSDCLTPGATCAGAEPDPAPVNSSVVRVSTGCTGPDCWSDAYPSLTAALSEAAARQASPDPDPRLAIRSVWVAGAHTAEPEGFRLPRGVRVTGGYRGTERRPSDRVAGAPPTVLTAPPSATDAVVVIEADDVVLEDVVVQDGALGGVRGTADDATLSNVRISGNTRPAQAEPAGAGPVPAAGGITWIGGSGLTVRNATISANTGPVGGIYLNGSTGATFESTSIRNNTSTRMRQTGVNANGAGGGGVAVDDATVTFDRSRIEDNNALTGGGVDVAGPGTILRLLSTRITGNVAEGNGTVVGRGGGVHAYRSARVLLGNCLVSGNRTEVGPRWDDPNAHGFGGGVFAYGGANLGVINCTVSDNDGGGLLVAQSEGSVVGATATVDNSIVVGNRMTWQPTFIDRYRFAPDGGYVLPGSQDVDQLWSFPPYEDVANGLLGAVREADTDIGDYFSCLGGDGGDAATTLDENCGYLWFRGLSASSSTEIRSSTANVTTRDSMLGAGSAHGSFGDFCEGLEYFGRSESPTVSNSRGAVTCGGSSRNGRYLGLRGRGYVGISVRPLAPPSSEVAGLFDGPGFGLVDGTNAVDRGNQDVDWDPFVAGTQAGPATDLAGGPRVVGTRIDLGAFERP